MSIYMQPLQNFQIKAFYSLRRMTMIKRLTTLIVIALTLASCVAADKSCYGSLGNLLAIVGLLGEISFFFGLIFTIVGGIFTIAIACTKLTGEKWNKGDRVMAYILFVGLALLALTFFGGEINSWFCQIN
jgi:hypothetical protein